MLECHWNYLHLWNSLRSHQLSSSVSILVLERLEISEILYPKKKLFTRNDEWIFHPLHPSARKWHHAEKSWILGVQDLLYGSWRSLWPFKLMILWNFLWNFWLEIKFWKQFYSSLKLKMLAFEILLLKYRSSFRKLKIILEKFNFSNFSSEKNEVLEKFFICGFGWFETSSTLF